jgi:predicted MFS family arabinose efflux permease
MVLYSLYWYGYFSSQPVWNIWISELITDHQSHEYFALRTRLTQIGIISGLVLGGGLLQWKVLNLLPSHVFGLLFSAAFVGQLFKYYSFKKHVPSTSVMSFSFLKIKHIFNQNRSFFSTYGLFNASLFLSAPYVTGYLLTTKNLNYFHFMLVTVSLFLGKIMSTYILSLFANKLSPIKLMALGGVIVAPLPLLWPYCHSPEAMYLLNFVSGLFWALWDVGLSLSFFKNISSKDKIETVTLYHSIGFLTQVIGTCIGALCIKYLFNYNYHSIFVFAGIIRFACILPFTKSKNLSVLISDAKNSSPQRQAS